MLCQGVTEDQMIRLKLPKNFQALAYGFGYLGPVIRVNKCKFLKKAGQSNHHGKAPWSFEYLWPLKHGGLMDILTSQVSYLHLGAAGSPKDWNDTI